MAGRTGTPLPPSENRMKHLIVASLALALAVPAFAKTTHAKTTTATRHKAHATAGKHHVAKKAAAHHKTANAGTHRKHA
jgi:hypothetical protein